MNLKELIEEQLGMLDGKIATTDDQAAIDGYMCQRLALHRLSGMFYHEKFDYIIIEKPKGLRLGQYIMNLFRELWAKPTENTYWDIWQKTASDFQERIKKYNREIHLED